MRKEIKKIALIIHSIKGGGAEKVAADLSIYFENKGYEVIFFVEHLPDDMTYSYRGRVVQLRTISSSQKQNRFDKIIYCILYDSIKLRRLKREYEIDISISFMQFYNLINILSKYKDKTVVTIHSVISKREDLEGTIGHNKWIFRILYQIANKIIFVSKYCQHDWKKNYGDYFNKTTTIYNPINTIRENNNTHSSNNILNNMGTNIVISVARFSSVKQHWHIIRAFSEVLKKCPDAHLILIGEGLLKAALVQLSKEMNLTNNIHFLGFVKNVDSYLINSKVFVQASKSEACSCALIETMSLGVPVVANDCPGGNREILDAINIPKYEDKNIITKYGIITPQLDGKKYTQKEALTKQEILMADAIVELLSNDKLRTQMSNNCKRKAKEYDLMNIGKVWCKKVIEDNI